MSMAAYPERFVRPDGARYLHAPTLANLREGFRLIQGYTHDVIDPRETQFLQRKTAARSACEAILLLTERPDGKIAITQTHLLPYYDASQLAVIKAMTPVDISESHAKTRHGAGKRRAVYLTTDPISMNRAERDQDPRFGPIYAALKAFNNDEEPDIIYIPKPTVEEIEEGKFPAQLELAYKMSVGSDGKVRHMYEVSGTSFRREGTIDELLQQRSGNFAYIW